MSDLVTRLLQSANEVYGTHPCGLMTEAAARIAEMEAALQQIADRTKRAHPQGQEGEIHQVAITALKRSAK
jgi:hypothetical protein